MKSRHEVASRLGVKFFTWKIFYSQGSYAFLRFLSSQNLYFFGGRYVANCFLMLNIFSLLAFFSLFSSFSFALFRGIVVFFLTDKNFKAYPFCYTFYFHTKSHNIRVFFKYVFKPDLLHCSLYTLCFNAIYSSCFSSVPPRFFPIIHCILFICKHLW